MSNMDGEQNAKWNKSDREREIVYDIIYMWSLKKYKKTSEYKKRQADSQMQRPNEGLPVGKRKGTIQGVGDYTSY